MATQISSMPWQGCIGQEVQTDSGATLLIENVHAVGGHGVVFKARVVDSPESIVAVKCLQVGSPIPASSFDREAALLENTPRHANLVAFLGKTEAAVGELGPGLVIEWAPGSLQDRIGKLPWRKFVPIFSGLLDVLQHLHFRGVIHRDLCPENVLFTGSEPLRPKLADFGIAVHLDGPMITADHHIFVKPGYSHPCGVTMAPCVELDLYGLGASAYRVLTGDFVPGDDLKQSKLISKLCSRYFRKHGEELPEPLAELIGDLVTGGVKSAGEARERLVAVSDESHESDWRSATDLGDNPHSGPACDELLPPAGGTGVLLKKIDAATAATLAASNSSTRRPNKLRLFVSVAVVGLLLSATSWSVWNAGGKPTNGTAFTAPVTTKEEPGAPPIAPVVPEVGGAVESESETAATPTTGEIPIHSGSFPMPDDAVFVVERGEDAGVGSHRPIEMTPRELRYERKSGEKIVVVPGPETQMTAETTSQDGGRAVFRTRLAGRLSRLEFQFPGLGKFVGKDAVVDLDVQMPGGIAPTSGDTVGLCGTVEGRLVAEEIGDPLKAAGIESLGIETTLTFDEEGHIRVNIRDLFFEIPQTVFVAALQKGMPESLPVPDHKLTDQFLIWRDLHFRKMELTNLVPSLSFDKAGALAFVMHPQLSGQLDRQYEHIVVDFPVETVANVNFPLVGYREIKTSVPRKRSDWRADTPSPFQLRATIPGRVEVTEAGGATLATTRIVLVLKTEPAAIDDIRLEKFPVIQELVPLLKTGISGIKLPAINREVLIEPFSQSSTEEQEALSRVRHVKLKFQPRGKNLEFRGSAVIETAGVGKSE